VDRFRIARHIDPAYATAFFEAAARGVEFAALRCRVDRAGIFAEGPVPVADLADAAAPAA